MPRFFVSYWDRLPFVARLLTTASLALVIAGLVMLYTSAQRDRDEAEWDLQSQLRSELNTLPPSLAELLVIGDYSTLQQTLDRQVLRQNISKIRFRDVSGAVLESRDAPVESQAPAWFGRWLGLGVRSGEIKAEVGGREYGTLEVTLTAQPAINRAWSRLVQHMAILLLVVSLDFVGIWLVLRSGLKPLFALDAGSLALSRGDLSVRIPPQGSPELRHSIAAFNQMAEQMEKLLGEARETSTRLRLATEAGGIGIWDYDLVSGRLDWDDQMYALYGLSPDSAGDGYQRWHRRVLPEDAERLEAAFQEALAGSKPYDTEFRVLHGTKGIRHLRGIATVLRDARGEPVRMVGVNLDMTEVRQAETMMAGEIQVLEAIAGSRPLPHVLSILCVNIEALLGDECLCSVLLLDEEGTHLRHASAPHLPESYVAAIDGAAVGPRNGTFGAALASGKPVITVDILADPLWEQYRDVAWKNGLRACWSAPFFSSQGKALGVFALYYEEPREPAAYCIELVTHAAHLAAIAVERSEAEEVMKRLNEVLERRVQEEVAKNREKDHLLIQQSRLAAMGEMVHNIAHQWRQPINALTLVLANLKDAQAYGELTVEEMERQVEMGNRLIQKMSATIDDFRNFFRPNKEKKAFPLQEAVDEVRGILGNSLASHGIALEVEMEAGVTVYGYPNELFQVLLNILNNSRDAIVERRVSDGRVRIVAGREGDRGVVRVSDNGGGIPPEVLPKVFDPYFTTKDKGSGIGLYMSKMIVESNMDGRLEARNVEGGAEFVLTLPLAEGVPERP
ncbi:MAG: ATP-binding protein [Sulfuricellaceae bacterium]|jgi:signal transduction histidine kinase/PAS domain-containing protein